MIEAQLFAWLTGFATLAALVATRVYPNPLPIGAQLPAIAWSRISSARVYSQTGTSRLVKARFQFDCWGATEDDAISTANALIQAIHAFPLGGAFRGRSNFIAGERDMPEPESRAWRRIVDALIHYQETL